MVFVIILLAKNLNLRVLFYGAPFRVGMTDRCAAILSPTERAQNREGTVNNGSRHDKMFRFFL